MRVIVVEKPGNPEVLRYRELPRPLPRSGWALIEVKAFGLNRSEMFTRQGHSGGAVKFPRVLGIECVGEVVAAPDTDLPVGQKVAAVMGGLGREYDGSYAEYTLAPRGSVIPLDVDLPWEKLAAIPEAFLTAWGSLSEAMDVRAGQTLLIRGGTASVGMAAITIAKDMGMRVIATTRSEAKREVLFENGADHVILDRGQIAEDVRKLFPEGVQAVLELVGTATLADSLRAIAPKGIVCNTGILGNAWVLDKFEPMAVIPSTVKLTTYLSETVSAANATEALRRITERAAAGKYGINVDRFFRFEEIVEAHQYMESNKARGKLVVTVDRSRDVSTSQ